LGRLPGFCLTGLLIKIETSAEHVYIQQTILDRGANPEIRAAPIDSDLGKRG